MKHITSLMLALLLSLSLTACGDVQTPGTPSEIPTSAPVPAPTEDDPPKVLIAYFTWADNTVVEDEDEAIQSALDHYESMGDRGNYDVDAISSASIVPPGNTAQLAAWIQQEVGSLCYYIPWGNLCFFYQDFRQSSSLIPLGTVSSGLERLEQLDTVASVTAELIE